MCLAWDGNGGDRKGSGGAAIIVVIIAVLRIALAWVLSQLVRRALSRSRECLADAGSVEFTKNPDAMISALRKIDGRGELRGATSAIMTYASTIRAKVFQTSSRPIHPSSSTFRLQ